MSNPKITIALGTLGPTPKVTVKKPPMAAGVVVSTAVPIGPPIVVKQTEPTAADYGQTAIPVNAVWIYRP